MEADIFISNYLTENEFAKRKYFGEDWYSKLIASNTNFLSSTTFLEVHKFWVQR
jgi:hypothetical protein